MSQIVVGSQPAASYPNILGITDYTICDIFLNTSSIIILNFHKAETGILTCLKVENCVMPKLKL